MASKFSEGVDPGLCATTECEDYLEEGFGRVLTPRLPVNLRVGHLFNIFNEMRNRDSLSQQELLVVLAIMRLGDEAYGVPIAEEIGKHTGREVVLASVYLALERLEDKKLVRSQLGGATSVRGGRAKLYFKVTAEGVRQVRDAQRALQALWRGIPQLQGSQS